MADAKKTVAKAIVPKTLVELRAEAVVKRKDLMESKRSHRAGELINPRVIGQTRKEIARLETAIRTAELAAQKESK